MSEFQLHEFQEVDVEKLVGMRNALIGSEMGTGKTHEAIQLDGLWQEALYDEHKRYFKTLVIAPLNTHDSWKEKYEMQLPGIDVHVIDRKNRHKLLADLKAGKSDVYVIHWDALRIYQKEGAFKGITWGVVIADEVHAASNRKAQVFRALKRLQTHHKLAMSGTATGDKPAGLWSILNWLWPKTYSSYWAFVNAYCEFETVETAGNPNGYRKITGIKKQAVAGLARQMKPWYVRHLKKEQCCEIHPDGVMSWLKDKTYDTIYVDLLPAQRKVYEQMRREMVAWVNEHEDTPLTASIVVVQLMRLSQMALAMPRVEERWVKQWNKDTEEWEQVLKTFVELEAPSTKIDALVELLQDHPDKSFVVFSSSKKMCYLAKEILDGKGISSEVFSGDTTDRNRERIKREFQEKKFQVFIGVIEAVGEGVDGLQHVCDTAVFLDRSWRTIKNKQAEDRLHRGGQKNSVQIIDIVARNTVDLGRRTKLEEKWGFIKTILGDNFNNQTYIREQGS